MQASTAAATRTMERMIRAIKQKMGEGCEAHRAPLNSLIMTESGSEYHISAPTVILGPERPQCPTGIYLAGGGAWVVRRPNELRPRLVLLEDDHQHGYQVMLESTPIVTQHYDA